MLITKTWYVEEYFNMTKSLNNSYSIGHEVRELWVRLKTIGWKVELRLGPKEKFPIQWAEFYAEMKVKHAPDKEGKQEVDVYHSHRPVIMVIPFWVQFEDFLSAVDGIYHTTVLPHVCGRDDGEKFDILGPYDDN